MPIPLNDYRAGEYLVPVGHIENAQTDEIAAAELAVDLEVEHNEVAHLVAALQMDTDGPDLAGFEWCLLANQFSLVPSFPMFASFNDRLLPVD